ncbi:MAG: dual specificity protein phosphatase family protein [Chloroflexota bacterium]
MSTPFPNAYWVRPRLLAGEHPMLLDEVANRQRVQRLIAAGVTVFLDLTEPEETVDLEPYMPLVHKLDAQSGDEFTYHRIPIPDMEVPTAAEMAQALDIIDAALHNQRTVYVHCWGGIGRTGTVIGCYLVQQGMDGEATIREIARLRQHTPDYRYPAPAREIQRQMVREWAR